ncbi:DUF7669 domain-containing protein [Deinococcus hopiensis]|uniref:DUF7669 domain-containing protein n=1 Tax=Deinococcus hopiensis KR-140 TaxID=695939 RepID=A0A1W1UQ23_9DEIO|nr:hypothetical protein SAMN00790413_04261 [Deinococcus hopiensis KR-140]
MGCRSQVLQAARTLARQSLDKTFKRTDLLEMMRAQGTHFSPQAIRTHVTATMCRISARSANVRYPDLDRVRPGRYRINGCTWGCRNVTGRSLRTSGGCSAKDAT